MECPKCKVRLKVYFTKNNKTHIIRYYKCPKCGGTVKTVES